MMEWKMDPSCWRRLPLVAVFSLSLSSAAWAETIYTGKSGMVTVVGTSTLHGWEMKGEDIKGSVRLDKPLPPSGDINAAVKNAKASIEIVVTSIKSDSDGLNDKAYGAMKAEEHKLITFEMTEARLKEQKPDALVFDTTGTMTISGTQKTVPLTVTVLPQNAGRRLIIKGSKEIAMSDFGITRPSAMLGTIKAGDKVTVSFDWTVEHS